MEIGPKVRDPSVLRSDPEFPEETPPEVELPPYPEGSILQEIKDLLGSIPFEMKAFDKELIHHINTAFFVLKTLGVPWTEQKVTGYNETWAELFPDNMDISGIIEYTYLSVKLVFDTPGTSYVINSFEARKEELEWRLQIIAERRKEDDTDGSTGDDSSDAGGSDAVWGEGDAVESASV